MAYLGPEFKHDIFFSYAHADVDRSGQALLGRWSAELAEEVRRRLMSRGGLADLSFYLEISDREGQRLEENQGTKRGLEESPRATGKTHQRSF